MSEKRYHVLHVDDDPNICQLTVEFLQYEREEFTVSAVHNVDRALEHIEENPVDAVVSDYNMPGKDGLDFLRYFRDIEPSKPFILFTGRGSEEIASQAISAGVTDYLQKEGRPEQYTVLANRLWNAIQKYEAEREADRGFKAIETSGEGIALLDDKEQFIYVNSAYTDILGYSKDELIGKYWGVLYDDAETVDEMEAVLENLKEGRESWTGNTTYTKADGTIVHCRHSLAYAEDGTLICTLLDITQEYESLQKIERQRNFIESALNSLDDIFFVLNPAGEIVRVNDVATEELGYSEAELVGSRASQHFVSESRDSIQTGIAEALTEGATYRTGQMKTKSGKELPYEFRASKLTDENGELIGVCGIGRNISEREQRIAQLQHNKNQFSEISEFLSHDIKNPLNIISGHTELGLKKADSETRPHFKSINNAAEQLDALVTDFSRVIKSDLNSTEVNMISLEETAREVWDTFETSEITIDVTNDVTPIYAEESSVKRLFQNAFENTIHHGGDHVSRIEIGLLASENGFYIEDNGEGFNKENGDWFLEAGNTLGEGTGLGLAIINQTAKTLGWDVRVNTGSAGGRLEFRGVQFEKPLHTS